MILTDPRFETPYALNDVREAGRTRDTTDKLAAVFEGLPGVDAIYGAHLHLEDQGRILRTHPFCWCERGSCPWCSGHLDTDDWDRSAHALLGRAADDWAEAGFVQGQGAPNLWYRDTDQGVDIRLWWYKYIGRGMEKAGKGPLLDLPTLARTIRPMVEAHIAGHLPNLWKD